MDGRYCFDDNHDFTNAPRMASQHPTHNYNLRSAQFSRYTEERRNNPPPPPFRGRQWRPTHYRHGDHPPRHMRGGYQPPRARYPPPYQPPIGPFDPPPPSDPSFGGGHYEPQSTAHDRQLALALADKNDDGEDDGTTLCKKKGGDQSDGDAMPSPVKNERVQRLLQDRSGPSKEPGFDAFDEDRWRANSRAPTPQEEWAKDSRGDWYPRSQWSARDGRARSRPDDGPSGREYMSDVESVNPNTTHGRYLQSLLNRAEDRERQRKKLKQPAFMSDVDMSETKSSHRSYTGDGRPRSDLGSRPPTMSDYGDRTWSEERRQLHRENQELRARLQRLEVDRQGQRPRRRGDYTTEDDGRLNEDRYQRRRRYSPRPRDRSIEFRNLKLPRFNGKDFAAFKTAFIRCARMLKYTEEQAATQLICVCEGPARSLLADLPTTTTAEDMMQALQRRYGYTLSYPDVRNKLSEIKRKPNEDLHSLRDRVLQCVRQAEMEDEERNKLARDTFFMALKNNRKLQHYVARRDKQVPYNIEVTLALALQYEKDNGRDDTAYANAANHVTSEHSTTELTDSSETVNKLMFSKTKHIKDPDLKKIGQTQNEMMEVLKKQADVLYQAFQSQSTPTRQSTGTSSAPKTSTPSSGGKTQQKQDKKPWKPWNKNKKFDKNKSNTKPTTTVNEVEDQPEEDEAAESEAEEQSDGGDVESQE